MPESGRYDVVVIGAGIHGAGVAQAAAAAGYRVLVVERSAPAAGTSSASRDLEALFLYHDAQTDDAALTRAVLDSAMALGAQLACPAQTLCIERQPDGWRHAIAARALPPPSRYGDTRRIRLTRAS